MKKFNNLPSWRQCRKFLIVLLAWFAMLPSWAQDAATDYFCITATENNTSIQIPPSEYSWDLPTVKLYYKKSTDTDWENYQFEDDEYYSKTITINKGEKVYFWAQDNTTNVKFANSIEFESRASGNSRSYKDVASNYDRLTGYFWHFVISKPVECSGNIMSMLYKDFAGEKSVGDYAFAGLFYNLNGNEILSAPTLPATTLGEKCYYGMFFNCTSLTAAPQLPATTLNNYCYAYMFAGCKSLQNMDVSFTSWPNNNATYKWAISTQFWRYESRTGYNNGYPYFQGYIRTFPNVGIFNCPSSLYSKTNYPTFPSGESQIPGGWTVADLSNDYMRFSWNGTFKRDGYSYIDTELKAFLELRESETLFTNNKNLRGKPNEIKVNLQYSYNARDWNDWTYVNGKNQYKKLTISYGQCLYIRAKGKNTTFSLDANNYFYFQTSLSKTDEDYGGILDIGGNIMSLLDPNMLRTDVPEYCFYKLFAGPTGGTCKEIFGAPTLPAIELAPYCYAYMFDGCSSLNSAPVLAATTEQLFESEAYNCYDYMFRNCKNLTYIKVGFDEWTITDAESKQKKFTNNWVQGVQTTEGTFLCPEKLPHAYANYNDSQIPTKWNNASSSVGATDEAEDYLAFMAETTTASVQLNRSVESLNNLTDKLQYTTDDGLHWYDYTWSGVNGKLISLSRKTGKYRVLFRSTVTDNSGRCSESDANYYYFKMNGSTSASGNVMSLLRKDCKRYDVGAYEFYKLFLGCSYLESAPSLPATSLGDYCYSRMFQSCLRLYTPPTLPALNLKPNCYQYMFLRCNGMTSVPDLDATVLANACYYGMFRECKTIETAPSLPATDLVSKCYAEMFYNCTKLTYINTNFLDWGDDNLKATTNWVNGVSDQGIFVCQSEIASTPQYGVNRIPHLDQPNKRWTIQESSKTSLYFEAKRNSSTIQLTKVKNPYNASLLYSEDDGKTWKDYNFGSTITLNKVGTNRVYFKAGKTSDKTYVANEKFSIDNGNYFKFVMKGSFNAHGNTMSLLSQDGSQENVPNYAFYMLFDGCKVLHTAPNLPATKIGIHSYDRLFQNCSALKSAPELPATELGNSCYQYMFIRCYKLATAPVLNATVLKQSCYAGMFIQDTSLVVAPHLPATNLEKECYSQMFAGCSNLQHMSVSFKKWHENATDNWVADYKQNSTTTTRGPKDNGIFMCPEELPHAANANPSNFGDSRIPRADVDGKRWKVNVSALHFSALNASQISLKKNGTPADVTFEYSVDNAVSWHAYTLGEVIDLKAGDDFYFRAAGVYDRLSTSGSNYYQFSTIGALSVEGNIMCMLDSLARDTSVPAYTFTHLFDGCEGLNNAPEMPASTVGEYAYAYMFQGCNGLTEVDTLRATNLSANCYRGMFTNCINLKTAPELPATNLANYCYAAMFNGCTNLKNASELPATTLKEGCYQSMFYGCSSLQIAPELPATTLATKCYNQMFYSCSRLSEISVNFSNWNVTDATTNWVNGVSNEGIFSCPTDLDVKTFSANRVPKNNTYKWIINPDFLGFKAKTDVTIALNRVGAPDTVMLIYAAKSKSKWEPYTWNGQNGYKIQLKAGESVYFRAEYDKIEVEDENHNITERANTFSKDSANYYQFAVTGTAAVTGNVAFLLSRNSINEKVPAYGFYRLFKDCEGLISAPEVSPVTEIANAHCYESMFEGCSNITNSPSKLPATVLSDSCYMNMFKGCEKMETVPAELPAIEMKTSCYEGTFEGCASITYTQSALPSQSLSVACYKNMFKGCSSLISCMESLPNPYNVMAHCYEGMFEGCESLVKAPTFNTNQNPAVASHKAMFKGCKSLTDNLPENLVSGNVVQESCYESMFEGCESMNTKINLPSIGLTKSCYKALFKDCKSLTDENLPTISIEEWALAGGESAFESMFEGCSNIVNASLVIPTAHWSSYPKAIMKSMFKNCTKLTTPLPIGEGSIAESSFESMYEGCTSLKKAPALGQKNLAEKCYYRMFAGCKQLKNAPTLPAKTENLKDSCYAYMFNGCKKLRFMDVAFTEWFDDNHQGVDYSKFKGATYMWVENVSASGTFMCPFGLNKDKRDASHIPFGWNTEDNGDYLYFYNKTENSEANLQLLKVGSPTPIGISYSTDNKKSWNSILGTEITWNSISFRDTVFIKISNGSLSTSENDYWYFKCSNQVLVGGNITSLLDQAMEQNDVPAYSFYKLFSGCPQIMGISDLKMPAAEVGAYAYANMFEGCNYLQYNSTIVPELPATKLGAYCYQNLFKGWKQLKNAPELPANTLAEGCYSNMFNGCTSLKNVSALPATQLVEHCYESMFDGCSSLNKLNVAFTAWEPASATTNWVRGVADEGHFTCPWALVNYTLNKYDDNIMAAYGQNMIPKDADNPWMILLITEMNFDYKTGLLSIDGRNPIVYSTDPTLSIDNTVVGTTVKASSTKVDLNAWLKDTKKPGLDSITYYAISGESMNDGKIIPGVNSLTIYRYPKEMGMCICDNKDRIKEGIYYANKVSSPNYPVKIFIPDGTYTFDETFVLKDSTISIIGESLTGTILESSAKNGVFDIVGDDIYFQDLQLTNTGSGAAFINRSLTTTLNIALGDRDYYLEAPGGIEHYYSSLPEEWNRAADTTQATIDHVDLNGSTMSITPGVNNTGNYLVRVDYKYVFASTKDFYMLENVQGKHITVRAANPRGGLGEPYEPNVIKAEGDEYTDLTIKLNSLGFASFSFDDNVIDQLQVIGASVFKGVYHKGDVYLTRMNDYDIIPRRQGVILVGEPNATLHLYKSNKDVDMDPYADVTGDNVPLRGHYSNDTIHHTADDGKYYFILSGNKFMKLLPKGTIRPNKAYFDLTGNVDSNVDNIRIIFGMWSDEEVTGIDYLPTVAENDNYCYTLSGIKTTTKKGLVIEGNKVVLKK